MSAAGNNLFELAASDSTKKLEPPKGSEHRLDLLSISAMPSDSMQKANPEVTKFIHQTDGRHPFFYALELKNKIEKMTPIEAKDFVNELKHAQIVSKAKGQSEVVLSTSGNETKVAIRDTKSNELEQVAKITAEQVLIDGRTVPYKSRNQFQTENMAMTAAFDGLSYGVLRALGGKMSPRLALIGIGLSVLGSKFISGKMYDWYWKDKMENPKGEHYQ